MPPRTGPRRKKRIKPAPAALRYFAVVLSDDYAIATTIAHRIELDDGNLVLRDEFDAIFRIFAAGDWREIRPLTHAEIAVASGPPSSAIADVTATLKRKPEPEPQPEPVEREQATLTNENDPAIPPEPAQEPVDRRFVPSSPEEAQRILMEMNRRLQDPDAPPPAPPRPKE